MKVTLSGINTVVSGHPAKASISILVTPEVNVAFVRESQELNAPSPTGAVITTLVRPTHWLKEYVPMLLRLVGKMIFVKWQSKKASSSIFVKPSEIVTFFTPVSTKAFSPMVVTGRP
jgi:hypothetical protein